MNLNTVDTRPSIEVFRQLVDRYIVLRDLIDIEQIRYNNSPKNGAANTAWNNFQKVVEPWREEQRKLFWSHPFEEMIWEHWMKASIASLNESFDDALGKVPDWVGIVFEMSAQWIEDTPWRE